MDNANYTSALVRTVVESGALEQDPFVLIDVGCGLGIDDAWRVFGTHLHAHGIDPQLREIDRLRRAEHSDTVRYHAAFVGLPPDHPIRVRRIARVLEESYFEPFGRTSAWAAINRATESRERSFYETNDWPGEELTSETIGLADLLRREDVASVDFVKTDTDGGDLDVLLSFESMIAESGVLGFMVETPFTGSGDEGVHTFSNVDRLLKRHGFLLASLTVNRYSRAVLPAPFRHRIMAQTVWGQPQWGDLVYLRDAAHPDSGRFGALTATKVIKLACLYDLFGLPDCAVDTLLAHRSELEDLIDVDAALDILTPPLHGVQMTYREYLAAFEADPTLFYPPPEAAPHIDALDAVPAVPPPSATIRQRVKHLGARMLGRV